MGFSWTKINKKSPDPIVHYLSKYLRKNHLNWGAMRNRIGLGFGANSTNSAGSYTRVNNAYGVANDYHLDTRYKSLAQLTGTAK